MRGRDRLLVVLGEEVDLVRWTQAGTTRREKQIIIQAEFADIIPISIR